MSKFLENRLGGAGEGADDQNPNPNPEPTGGAPEGNEGGQDPNDTPKGESSEGSEGEINWSLLEGASNGTIKDADTLQSILERSTKFETANQELSTARQRIAELESSGKLDDLSSKIVEMRKEGASMKEISLFLKMQEYDLDNMSDEDAVKTQLSLSNPDLTPKQIDILYKRDYAPAMVKGENEEGEEILTVDDSDKELKDILLKQSARKAREEIKKMKVQSSKPVSQEEKRQVEARLQALETNWGKVLEGSVEQYQKGKIQVGDYAYEYEIPADVVKSLLPHAAKYARNQNFEKFSTDEAGQVGSFVQNAIFGVHGKKILESIAKDAIAFATEKALKGEGNPKPVDRTGKSPEEGKRTSRAAMFKELRKR